MTRDKHAERARELRRKLGCDCDYCEGLTDIDEGARCVFQHEIVTALRQAAADERAALIDEVCPHRPLLGPGTGMTNVCCRIAYRLRARGKGEGR